MPRFCRRRRTCPCSRPYRPTTRPAGIGAFRSAFGSFPAPFGDGGPAAGVQPVGTAPATPGSARTHYAFDSTGNGGTVRVIVIDNSSGSLEASDPHQNPARAAAPMAGGGARRGTPAGHSRDRRRQPRPQLHLQPEAERRHRRRRDGAQPDRGRRVRLLLRAPGGEPRLPPRIRQSDDSRIRDRHARLPLVGQRPESAYAPGRAVRRQRLPADAARPGAAQCGDQPRAGRRAADPGDLRPLDPGRRRLDPAPQPPGAVPGARPQADRAATAGARRRARMATPTRPAPTHTWCSRPRCARSRAARRG